MDNTNDRLIIEAMKKMSKKNILKEEYLKEVADEVSDVFVGDIKVKNADDDVEKKKEEKEEEIEVTLEEVTKLINELPADKLKEVRDFVNSLAEKKEEEEGEKAEHEASETKEEEAKEEEGKKDEADEKKEEKE